MSLETTEKIPLYPRRDAAHGVVCELLDLRQAELYLPVKIDGQLPERSNRPRLCDRPMRRSTTHISARQIHLEGGWWDGAVDGCLK